MKKSYSRTKTLEESIIDLKIAFKDFVLHFAYSIKLDKFINWLNNKLKK